MKARLALGLIVLVGVAVRIPFWMEALRTPLDGDSAIIGLMARHLGQGITMWGQPYGSPLEAWLAAPVLAVLGPTAASLRLFYFVLGIALIPLVYLLAGALHRDAALPAAILLACPPPYFLLLSALPPPLYPTALVLCGLLLILAFRLGDRLAAGETPLAGLALWGALGGLALWTHLMCGSIVAASGVYLARRARGGRAALLAGLLPLVAASAPWWVRTVGDGAARVVSVSGRQQTMFEHLAEVLPALHRPVGGLIGTHVPLIADDPDRVVLAPGWVAGALILIYGTSLVLAVRASRGNGRAALLVWAAALALAAFPFPLRSGPSAIRFLTPIYLTLAALVAWVPVTLSGARRALVVALALATLHLVAGARLLAAWRQADRAAAPFLLPDLAPVRRVLDAHGIRRAYASYGPAYRLTFESGEAIIVSQPWNERFLHEPLPYLDEVRFAKNVAWVLTPEIPTDMPSPREFDSALGRAEGTWRRTVAGPAVVYHGFVPPFDPAVEPLAAAGRAGDADLTTRALAPADRPSTFVLPAPRALDAVTLVAGYGEPSLLRSMDVEVSVDGVAFETVARRRRRGEREDLRWVNGHPQFVLDHDLLAIPLGGRRVAALRITPIASGDPWALGELLLHPSVDAALRRPWDEWLDPGLSWAGRRRALSSRPRRDREDWYYRSMLAQRER